MLSYLWIGLGGAIGSLCRFWLSGLVAQRVGETFPWGTLVINISGSFAIGLFTALTDVDGRLMVSPGCRQFFIIGVCGGYTTFSSFSVQTLSLMNDGDWLKAGANAVLSVGLCLAAVWVGHMLAMSINR
jgi:CrcB protein